MAMYVATFFVPGEYRHFEDQIRDVCLQMQLKEKVLMLLRGLPGSGKSTFANILVSCLGQGKIFSADNYFYDSSGRYQFRMTELSNAHAYCRSQVENAASVNEALIIVDNTNIEKWQMLPYAKMAAKHGYHLMLLEPNTAWRMNPQQLAKKNTHSIPRAKILELKDRYQTVTAEELMRRAESAAKPKPAARPEPAPEPARPQRSQRKRRNSRGSQNESHDMKAMFEALSLQVNPQNWAELYPYRASSPNLSQHLNPPQPAAPVAVKPPCRDATTCVSDIDEALFDNGFEEGFVKDVGYTIVEASSLILAVCGGAEKCGGGMEIDAALMRKVSRFHHEASQTDLSELNKDAVPAAAESPAEGDAEVNKLRGIFPDTPEAELVAALRETGGDVEAAIELCLDAQRPQPSFSTSSPCSSGSSRSDSECHDWLEGASELAEPQEETETEAAPRLGLSKDFLRIAHARHCAEFRTEEVDIDSLPPELHQDWVLPPALVRDIYRAYLAHLGFLEESPSVSPPGPRAGRRQTSQELDPDGDDDAARDGKTSPRQV